MRGAQGILSQLFEGLGGVMIDRVRSIPFNDTADLFPVPSGYICDRPRHLCSRVISFRLDATWALLINALTGAVDAVRQRDVKKLREAAERGDIQRSPYRPLLDRGYFLRSARAEERWFQDICGSSRHEGGTGLGVHLFVTERCNFACAYCFESCNHRQSRATRVDMQMSSVAPIFRSIRNIRSEMHIPASEVVIKIIGGEPLLPQFQGLVQNIMEHCAGGGYSATVTTNGYYLDRFLPLLRRHCERIPFLLVTLDGPPAVHNRRRFLRGGGPTFDRIVSNIDHALNAGLWVLLRTNVDEVTIRALPRLVGLYRKYGWHRREVIIQLNPVFCFDGADSAHQCLLTPGRLHQRLEPLLRSIRRTFRNDAWVNIWGDYIANDLSRVLGIETTATELSERGSHPFHPRVYSCMSQRLRDICYLPDGRIYPCVATAAEHPRPLGRYLPKHSLDRKYCSSWRQRDVGMIKPCRSCPVALLCGGMCPVQFDAGAMAAPGGSCDEYAQRLGEFVRIHRKAICRRLQRLIRLRARDGRPSDSRERER